ncbi:flagellar biosynthesis anti-sigma factor FlgM [Amphritea pacifica]|uniref:Negative regulator of flagellin synthesis n=1 Tax=Amphritea pacifica TaxID=2811233 RepID=A0ABS2W505_9GAMM|nr:flagellar biosynthesis anti-sigma factor FlgM [Amphritea pacifica]MBN0986792.1 flagellar biosynthesis anti-sigma factor FlgM [Amphritea pacifica]MBN1005233.1 flagellar biosynthesis anti-sigma factor FlgM [Amphritea pacifica]
MVIDITGLTSSSQAANSRAKVNDQPAAESKSQQTTATETPVSAGVSLSDAAQAVQKSAGQVVEEGISVNEQKVAELKAAIDDGSYQINYESTARGLFQIESMLD